MSQQVSLKEAERKVFTSAFQDGLWDVLIGCFVLIFAIAPLLSVPMGDFLGSVVFLPFWALAYLAVWLIRRLVVVPRIGVVKFGPSRKKKLSRFVAVMVVVNLAGLVLGILSARASDQPGWVVVTIFGLLVLTLFCVAGYFLDFARLYLYGALVALSPLVGEWLYIHRQAAHHGFPITFGATAATMVGVGLVKFALFMRGHPKTAEASPPVES